MLSALPSDHAPHREINERDAMPAKEAIDQLIQKGGLMNHEILSAIECMTNFGLHLPEFFGWRKERQQNDINRRRAELDDGGWTGENSFSEAIRCDTMCLRASLRGPGSGAVQALIGWVCAVKWCDWCRVVGRGEIARSERQQGWDRKLFDGAKAKASGKSSDLIDHCSRPEL